MITLSQLRQIKEKGEKFSCLTCYDATFAKAIAVSGIETILIGDSLGMVVQGHDSTLPVTVEDIVYHTQAVARANKQALIIADMPFMSYASVSNAIDAATRLMQAGAHMVKLEGGAWLAETVAVLTQGGIPCCVHMGLTPQSVNVLGGYKLQAKTEDAVQQLLRDGDAVVQAGAVALLLEVVPSHVAELVTQRYAVPVIGIGAGNACDGQVLVLHDMLGLSFQKPARFVHDFLADAAQQVAQGTTVPQGGIITLAMQLFHQAVKTGTYPAATHAFHSASK